ncbi:hypothetical protein TTHERM_000006289 (macronuclear) [Tetrahymena thermophila SB210]|uniref:Transmembrane protein n=1 Tax=Tetrahymena thermophila (strain SB210) TaxID=312017 RepID=W7XGX6_TETTS|nr:hypothetical protein TTHERM_000006289 [Tetrahymena thermophila SB210]EWS76308.1 hypothetical protein TTHERM_000006289 [Tetrahymena thermophila SB210]|eukprot:XP_012651092.1 hypothetical protein TTHERM_000006289 [Tetrahymena thermophila SB210]
MNISRNLFYKLLFLLSKRLSLTLSLQNFQPVHKPFQLIIFLQIFLTEETSLQLSYYNPDQQSLFQEQDRIRLKQIVQTKMQSWKIKATRDLFKANHNPFPLTSQKSHRMCIQMIFLQNLKYLSTNKMKGKQVTRRLQHWLLVNQMR